MLCELCGRDRNDITAHHLIPRTLHRNPRVKAHFGRQRLQETADLCQPCHRQIHRLLSEKELGWNYHSIAKLKAHAEVANWIEWVSRRNF